MPPVKEHFPGKPSTPKPAEYVKLMKEFVPPKPVISWGETTTTDGRWALMVTVPPKTNVPVAAVEALNRGFPVVYLADPGVQSPY